MDLDSSSIRVNKLHAAHCQLQLAIRLWFSEDDPISTHTLACAAHQIIHDINTKRGGRDLLLDTLIIKDEYRKEWIGFIKKDMNFFKHADKDPNGIIEFKPVATYLFLMMSVLGLKEMGETLPREESVFLYWMLFNKPKWLTEKGREFINHFTTDQLESLRGVSKREFYNIFMSLSAGTHVHP